MTSEGRAPRPGGSALVAEVDRRLTRLGWLAGGAGVVVVFTAIGFLIPVFLDPGERIELGLINAPMVAIYLLVAGLISLRVSRRRVTEATRWIVEERAPDEGEHARTLRLAAEITAITAVGWAVGGLLFAAINLTHSLGFAAVIATTTWLGGETTCALVYLLTEQALRPVTARALAARLPAEPIAPGVRGRLLIAWSLGTAVPVLGVLVVGLVGVTKSDVDLDYVAAAGVFLALVALTTGWLSTVFAARAIADPVTSVRAGLARVGRGELETAVDVDDGSEIGLLQAGFNEMAEGLRERERIRDLFGRQVGHEVAGAALRDGATLGGEEREVAALFIDLVGSTSLAQSVAATEVVSLLNRFFRVVVETVESRGGFVNKFEGDAALCVFGAPLVREDPAGDALAAARTLLDCLGREIPELDFGIGVSAGIAVAGNVGAEQRFEYTVIGDPVNEAARLCELAKQRPGRLLASEAALQRAGSGERAEWELRERTLLRGRRDPTGVAAPVG